MSDLVVSCLLARCHVVPRPSRFTNPPGGPLRLRYDYKYGPGRGHAFGDLRLWGDHAVVNSRCGHCGFKSVHAGDVVRLHLRHVVHGGVWVGALEVGRL